MFNFFRSYGRFGFRFVWKHQEINTHPKSRFKVCDFIQQTHHEGFKMSLRGKKNNLRPKGNMPPHSLLPRDNNKSRFMTKSLAISCSEETMCSVTDSCGNQGYWARVPVSDYFNDIKLYFLIKVDGNDTLSHWNKYIYKRHVWSRDVAVM